MKKFCGRSLEKSRDQIFQKIRFFCKKCFFLIDKIYIKWIEIVWRFERKKNCLVPPTQKFQIVDISKCVNGNKIRTKNSLSAWKFASNDMYWYYGFIPGTKVSNEIRFSRPRNYLFVKKLWYKQNYPVQLSYIIRSGILCWFRITQSIRCLKVSVPVYWYAVYIRYWDKSLLSR